MNDQKTQPESTPMTREEYFASVGRPGVEALCREHDDLKFEYVYQVCLGLRKPGWKLCRKLAQVTPVPKEYWNDEIYGDDDC